MGDVDFLVLRERYEDALRQVIDWMMYVHRCLDDEAWENGFRELAAEYGLETLAVTMTRMCREWLGLQDSITWDRDIDLFLKEKYHVELIEPEYSGWPVYDNDGNEIPYWRIIGSRGAVTGAYRCNAQQQGERLTQEGIEVVPYKKSFRVVDYKKYLYSFIEMNARKKK